MSSSTDSDASVVDPDGARGTRLEAVSAAAVAARRRRRVVVGTALGTLAVLAVVVVLRGRDQGWTIEAAGSSNELVADDRTVCGTNLDDLLFCLDGATGRELFREQLVDRPVPFSIVEGTLLVGDHTGGDDATLLAYSLEGDLMWEVPLADSTLPEPPVAGGIVAVQGEDDSELVGFDLATGEERWRSAFVSSADQASGRLRGRVLTDGQSFYASVVSDDAIAASAIVAVDPASGTESWRSEIAITDLPAHAIAPFDDGSAVAFVVGQLGRHLRVVVLDTATGRLRWQAPLTHAAAALAHVDGVTVALFGAELRGYSTDGDELWTAAAPTGYEQEDDVDTGVLLFGSLFVAGDDLYFHSSHLYAIDPATGESREVIGDSVGDVVATAEHLVAADICCHFPEQIEARPL